MDNLPDLGGYPNINFNNIGLTQLTFPYSTDPGRRDRAIQAQDHVSWFRGKHTIKMGGQFSRYSTLMFTQDNGLFGNVTFSNRYTGNTYADFLLGIPFQSSRLNPLVGRKRTDSELGIFVQDAFKVSSRLTLDRGVGLDRRLGKVLASGSAPQELGVPFDARHRGAQVVRHE